jgi:Mrp family chromosome partitioning ATPase
VARVERAKNQHGRGGSVASMMPVMGGPAGLAEGKLITLYSPKGGVGTTTLAVNLAIALHNDDTRVVLVDGNRSSVMWPCSSTNRARTL